MRYGWNGGLRDRVGRAGCRGVQREGQGEVEAAQRRVEQRETGWGGDGWGLKAGRGEKNRGRKTDDHRTLGKSGIVAADGKLLQGGRWEVKGQVNRK